MLGDAAAVAAIWWPAQSSKTRQKRRRDIATSTGCGLIDEVYTVGRHTYVRVYRSSELNFIKRGHAWLPATAGELSVI